jgi:hypothetical protein
MHLDHKVIKSLQSKYTVDGAGFGNTGARDEFGLATLIKRWLPRINRKYYKRLYK